MERGVWVEIGSEYAGCLIQLWTNYPRSLIDDLNQTEDAALRKRTLARIVLAHNDWVDYDGAAFPPTDTPAFWDVIPDELAAALVVLINQQASAAGALTEGERNRLSTWLRTSDKRGLKVPWKYIRHQFAEKWHVPPWLIDESPIGEVELEAQITNIEATVAPPGEKTHDAHDNRV